MSTTRSETLFQGPRRYNVSKMRVHDYLYDSAYIVSGARDYARTAFKAAMSSAQMSIMPVYTTMFSEVKTNAHIVYHPNCRLPEHIDRSYRAYVERVQQTHRTPAPQLTGKDRFKFAAVPKKVLPERPPSPPRPPSLKLTPRISKPRNRGTQSMYRETSAQTRPWQPDAKAAETCEETPEVLYLDKLEWGPGVPYRMGDLPADFHTTEIINKMRHARTWMTLVEKNKFPDFMKNREAIITDVETNDWIFREAEIDELQSIRLSLLHKLQANLRMKQNRKTSLKLEKLWNVKKTDMEHKVKQIRRDRDRELRKLTAFYSSGRRAGLVRRLQAARGGGPVTFAAADPTSDLHGPLARHGYQARRRHADICYDPSLLILEDHQKIAEPPAWLEQCGANLKLSCSGHALPQDKIQLCIRETKWSEKFLENLHDDLKKARLGAVMTTAGPLNLLKPRRVLTPRPATPEVDPIHDDDESSHQAALLLQKIIRGRAVQNLMYEGRTRAAELTEELKTTHGLQKEDKLRIARDEIKARDFNVYRMETEHKEDAISSLVDELCGGAVAAALDFLEKELRRLKQERRHHAFLLIALREKTLREAAEAGRRQKEEHRRREHDQMFKHILGVTHETVDVYLKEIVEEGAELAAEEDAVARAKLEADKIELSLKDHGSMSTAEQHELVAELVQQFLLPDAHKAAHQHYMATQQKAKLEAARKAIFGHIDEAEIQKKACIPCGAAAGQPCRCRAKHTIEQIPVQTTSRDDPRWKQTRTRPPHVPLMTISERYPPHHDFRCMLNTLVDDVVAESRCQRRSRDEVRFEVKRKLQEKLEGALEAKDLADLIFDEATGALTRPVKEVDRRFYMYRKIEDALDRTEPVKKDPCPKELPSEIRRREEEAAALADPTCRCDDEPPDKFALSMMTKEEKSKLLPSELRVLEDLRRCKCDYVPAPSAASTEMLSEDGTIMLDPPPPSPLDGENQDEF